MVVLKIEETDFYFASSYLALNFFLNSINLLLLVDLPFCYRKAVFYMSALYLCTADSHCFSLNQRNRVSVIVKCRLLLISVLLYGYH